MATPETKSGAKQRTERSTLIEENMSVREALDAVRLGCGRIPRIQLSAIYFYCKFQVIPLLLLCNSFPSIPHPTFLFVYSCIFSAFILNLNLKHVRFNQPSLARGELAITTQLDGRPLSQPLVMLTQDSVFSPSLFFGPAHPQVALLHSFNITNHLFCVNGVFIGDDTDACSSIQALFARVEEAKDVDGMKRKRLWQDAVKKHVHRGGATVSSVTRMFP